MKLWQTALLLCASIVTACGGSDTEIKTSKPQYADEVVPTEIREQVPSYVIARINKETGAVDHAVTNEPPQQFDLSTEEGRQAYGKSEAERFSRAKPIKVKKLEGDADYELETSTESFFGGCGFGGLGFGAGGCGFGLGLGGYGFGYGLSGIGAFGGFGFGSFGLGAAWGGGCGIGLPFLGFGGCGAGFGGCCGFDPCGFTPGFF